jgi:hypothetical protein
VKRMRSPTKRRRRSPVAGDISNRGAVIVQFVRLPKRPIESARRTENAILQVAGNGLIRGTGVRAVSPHLDPLPSAFAARQSAAPARRRQGEGTARIAQWKAGGSGLFSAERRVHPLPKGEGWGEGKETTGPRRADVLVLACGQCPQGSMALCHRNPR